MSTLGTGSQDPAETGLFWAYRQSGRLPAGKMLMYALIENAVQDIRRARTAGQLRKRTLKMERLRQRVAAIAWVYSDDTTWSHSFLNCCDELGWWPALVRQLIRRDIESAGPLTSEDPEAHWLRSDIRQVRPDK